MNNSLTIRPGLTMSKMRVKKNRETPITDDTFMLRKLDVYRQMYDGLNNFRLQRERAARYFNGDQWSDFVDDENGNTVKEGELISQSGLVPMKQNLIKSTIRSLVGQFRTDTSRSVVVSRTPDKSEESEMLSNALQYALSSINNSREIDARALEEFLISGLPVQRISWGWIKELKKYDVTLKNIHPNTIFFNNDIEDIRGNDIRVIGRIIDYTFDQLIVDFGTTPERKQKLREIYRGYDSDYFVDLQGMDSNRYYSRDFYVPSDVSKCRVIEVWEDRLVTHMEVHDWMDGSIKYYDWSEKDLERANRFRIQKYASIGVPAEEVPIMEGRIENVQKMFYTYYSPYGHVLREGETPFEHGSHPFILTPYPLLDGNITGMVTDLIDAQRQLNRLLIMRDMILASSTKKTLVLDARSLEGTSQEVVEKQWKKIGGVVVLKMDKTMEKPFETSGTIGNLGITEGIQLYMKMLQDVSGVSPAMQGQKPDAGTSGVLYQEQITQSTLNSKDIMDTFSGLFRKIRDMKTLKTIQQYYTDRRMIAISGRVYSDTAQLYDPDRVKDMDFDLVIGQTADSPVYRNAIDQTLLKFVDRGLIDLEMFLEQTSMPFSHQLLESLRKRKEEAQTDPRAAVQGLSQDIQKAGIGGDQQVVNDVYNRLRA